MTPKVIITGDDYGYSDGVNAGIRRAYQEGILTSTSVLGTNGISEQTPLSPTLPKPPLGIGVHLHLTYGKPARPDVWDFSEFTRPYKDSRTPQEWQGSAWSAYFAKFSQDAIEQEFAAQIAVVQKFFGNVDHIDSHHGVASYPPANKAYEMVAKKFHLPVRPLSPLSENHVYGGEFLVDTESINTFRGKSIATVDSANMSYWHTLSDPIGAFCKDLATVKPGEVKEYMFHPSIDDSQGAWRMKDLEILTNRKVIDTIKQLDIQLTTYAESAR